jgi:hypothetical protein
VERDEVASRYSGWEVQKRPVTELDLHDPARPQKGGPPDGMVCRGCGSRTEDQVCPNCHYGPLIRDWRKAETVCIAMTGARTTGKSCYVGIVIKELEAYLLEMNLPLVFADASTTEVYTRVYEAPLLRQSLIGPTRVVKDAEVDARPLIWNMGAVGKRQRYLVVRDLPGEELEGDISGSEHLRFLAQADAVFFMFDPLKVPEIADRLRGLVPTNAVGGDPQNVLNNVLRLIGSSQTRLAVVLSKFDTLEELRKVKGTEWCRVMSNPGAAVIRCPGASVGYDDNDGRLVDLEVRSLLLKLNAQKLVVSLEQPSSCRPVPHRYFAVSVLGHAPRADGLNPLGISPHRCLDPLKWVLAETGTIPVTSRASA